MELEQIVLTFDRPYRAQEALQAVRSLAREETIALTTAAIVRKDRSGKVHIRGTREIDVELGTLLGAVIGGLVGIAFGPGSVILGMLVGGVIGSVVTLALDALCPQQCFSSVEQGLTPESAALVVLVEQRWAPHLAGKIAALDGGSFGRALVSGVGT